MSSKYTKQRDHLYPCNTRSINLSKVAGALQSPNGMTLNWKSPECVAKAVLHLASGDRDTCQYPLARSRVENHRLPANISSVSSIRGSGYASFTVPASYHRTRFWCLRWLSQKQAFQHRFYLRGCRARRCCRYGQKQACQHRFEVRGHRARRRCLCWYLWKQALQHRFEVG